MVFVDRSELGVTVKVVLELEIDGVDDICTHELKLSEETCKTPEHVVLEVLVVTVVVSIASLNVTAIVELIETVAESAGEDEETVGAVVSVVVVLSVVVVAVVVVSVVDSSFSSLQEKTVRLKQKISKMNNPFFIFSSIPKVKYYCFVY